MNFLPLWTASVCPMNSGVIVERRDHVRTTFFSLFSFIAATFFVRWSSVNGPFFSDLLMPCLFPFLVYRFSWGTHDRPQRETRNQKRSSLLALPADNPLIRP